MTGDETPAGERCETIDELSHLLFVVQRMGHRLAYETHGDAYDKVRELNELLHKAHVKLVSIKKAISAARPAGDGEAGEQPWARSCE